GGAPSALGPRRRPAVIRSSVTASTPARGKAAVRARATPARARTPARVRATPRPRPPTARPRAARSSRRRSSHRREPRVRGRGPLPPFRASYTSRVFGNRGRHAVSSPIDGPAVSTQASTASAPYLNGITTPALALTQLSPGTL